MAEGASRFSIAYASAEPRAAGGGSWAERYFMKWDVTDVWMGRGKQCCAARRLIISPLL